MKHLLILMACLAVFVVCKPSSKGPPVHGTPSPAAQASSPSQAGASLVDSQPKGFKNLHEYQQALLTYLSQLKQAKEELLKNPDENSVAIFRVNGKIHEVEEELTKVAADLSKGAK